MVAATDSVQCATNCAYNLNNKLVMCKLFLIQLDLHRSANASASLESSSTYKFV